MATEARFRLRPKLSGSPQRRRDETLRGVPGRCKQPALVIADGKTLNINHFPGFV